MRIRPRTDRRLLQNALSMHWWQTKEIAMALMSAHTCKESKLGLNVAILEL